MTPLMLVSRARTGFGVLANSPPVPRAVDLKAHGFNGIAGQLEGSGEHGEEEFVVLDVAADA